MGSSKSAFPKLHKNFKKNKDLAVKELADEAEQICGKLNTTLPEVNVKKVRK